MFDLGWWEMAVVALIALMVIGPKDLPRVLRTAGKWAGKARAIAREFRVGLDDMVREADLDDVKKGVESVTSYNPKKDLEDSIDPTGEMARDLDPNTIDARETPAADAPHPDTEAYEGAGSEAPEADGRGTEEPAGDTESSAGEPPEEPAGDTESSSEEPPEEPPAKASAGG